ncbi:MAG: hypothetical protein ACYDGM_10245 [Vulcanimicrobiaceae bacterium]
MKHILTAGFKIAGASLWLSVLAIGIVGYSLGILPLERQLRATLARAQLQYDERNANQHLLAHAADIKHARDRVRLDIRRRSGRADASSALATALRVVATEAAANDVEIRSLTPGHTSKEHADMFSESMTVNVVGHFANIMTLLVSLSRHDVLIGIGDVRIEALSQAPSSRPLLHATINGEIDRIDPKYVEEDVDVARTAR